MCVFLVVSICSISFMFHCRFVYCARCGDFEDVGISIIDPNRLLYATIQNVISALMG